MTVVLSSDRTNLEGTELPRTGVMIGQLVLLAFGLAGLMLRGSSRAHPGAVPSGTRR